MAETADNPATRWYSFDVSLGNKDGTVHVTKVEIEVLEWWIDSAPYDSNEEQKRFAWWTAKWYIKLLAGNTKFIRMSLPMVLQICERMGKEK